MFKEYTILFVEDDIDLQNYMHQILKDECAHLFMANNGEEGLSLYKIHTPDIVITDLHMPKLDGLAMCKEIKKENFAQEIILLTGHGYVEKLREAINIGVNAFIPKPISDINLLFTSINKAIKHIHYNRELYQIKKQEIKKRIEIENLVSQILYTNDDYVNFDAIKFE